MTRRRFACSTCAIALLVLAGCGKRAAVEGTVTFDGAPVDGGAIHFTSEQVGPEPRGTQIVAGKYVIKSENGPTPGKYKVQIIWNKPTGKMVPNKNDSGTEVEETQQLLPSKYNSKTELTAEIKSGSNTFNFDLKSGGPVDSGKPPPAGKTKAVGD